MTDQNTFNQLAKQGFNRIPVHKELLADLETPLSCYLKLANGPYSYLFESVQGGEKWARYSIIGLPCSKVIRIHDDEIQIVENGNVMETIKENDPLKWIERYQQQFKVAAINELSRFTGGLVGYFGYDTVRYIEPRLRQYDKADPLGTPDILLMVSEQVVVFDNLRGKIHLIVLADPEQSNAWQTAQHQLHNLQHQLMKSTDYQHHDHRFSMGEFRSNVDKQDYLAAVDKSKQYIVDGDVMQVVYSQRLSIDYPAPPIELYRALRCMNPSPYMYYLNLDDFYIVGSSPEILVHVEDQVVTVRPIAGTRKRGQTTADDDALEADLLSDKKELAEHLMLIDLGRNDVGRVSETGSVELTEKMNVERYSHVMHIVSNVQGKLKPEMSAIDALRATLPAGTLSGAPKVRAMEIIDELEHTKRGVYGGAVGYLAWNGNMDTAIAIRTAVIKDQKLHIQAGGGLVYDSVPEMEWQESMNKARAVIRAVEMVSEGL